MAPAVSCALKRRDWKAEQARLEARAVEAEAAAAVATTALARLANGGTDGMGPADLRAVGEELHAALAANTQRQAMGAFDACMRWLSMLLLLPLLLLLLVVVVVVVVVVFLCVPPELTCRLRAILNSLT